MFKLLHGFLIETLCLGTSLQLIEFTNKALNLGVVHQSSCFLCPLRSDSACARIVRYERQSEHGTLVGTDVLSSTSSMGQCNLQRLNFSKEQQKHTTLVWCKMFQERLPKTFHPFLKNIKSVLSISPDPNDSIWDAYVLSSGVRNDKAGHTCP